MSSKKAISRNRIIEVAFGMARESGLASLSVRAIAEACGVATGTIYNHVPDVAELRTEVLQRFWREAIEAAELETCTRDAETALDYCRRLSNALSSSLEGFRTAWLRDMGALDGRTRQRTMEAERACLGDCTRRSGTHSRGTRLSPAGLAIAFKWMRWWTSPGRRCSTR